MNSYLLEHVNQLIESLEPYERALISDGYHSFEELYLVRGALTARLFTSLLKEGVAVVKSRRHSDGRFPFGNPDWFVVFAQLPEGQISFHYRVSEWWDNPYFQVIPEVHQAPKWDGHDTKKVIKRLAGKF